MGESRDGVVRTSVMVRRPLHTCVARRNPVTMPQRDLLSRRRTSASSSSRSICGRSSSLPRQDWSETVRETPPLRERLWCHVWQSSRVEFTHSRHPHSLITPSLPHSLSDSLPHAPVPPLPLTPRFLTHSVTLTPSPPLSSVCPCMPPP